MIMVNIIGGIGNQMFQYAAGRRVAHHRQTTLQLDVTGYRQPPSTMTRWNYRLDVFNIHAELATDEEVMRFKPGLTRWSRILARSLSRLNLSHQPRYVRERHFHFDPRLMSVPPNAYLEGYWQSEKYFSDISTIIRQELTLKAAPDNANRQMLQRILETNAVAIHVRRGDYVTNPSAAKLLPTCPAAYYRQAAAMMSKRIKNPHFFIFSDDPDWARTNLNLPYPHTFVTHNLRQRDEEDMRLMNACKNFIIANSSFSWWGAWLAPDKNKTIIAPMQWFNDPAYDTRDLIPASWIRL